MDIDTYMLEWLVKARLAEARACSARYALLSSLRAERRSLVALVGLALIRAGRWVGRRRAVRRRGARLPSPSLP